MRNKIFIGVMVLLLCGGSYWVGRESSNINCSAVIKEWEELQSINYNINMAQLKANKKLHSANTSIFRAVNALSQGKMIDVEMWKADYSRIMNEYENQENMIDKLYSQRKKALDDMKYNNVVTPDTVKVSR